MDLFQHVWLLLIVKMHFYSILVIYGWVSMGFDGICWFLMVFDGFRWGLVGFDGFRWRITDFLLLCVVLYIFSADFVSLHVGWMFFRLSALNTQLLANAAAQSGLQFSQSGGMMGQSVIRRVGKATIISSGAADSSQSTTSGGSSGAVKEEDDDSEDEPDDNSMDNSENGMDDNNMDDNDDRSSDRGPTIAQLTSSTTSVIRSTKGLQNIIDWISNFFNSQYFFHFCDQKSLNFPK